MKAPHHMLFRTAILAGVVCTGMQALQSSAQAAGLKTYASAKYGYAIKYPSNWKNTPQPQQDFTVEAPDGNALLATAITGMAPSVSESTLEKLITNEIKKQGAKASTIKTGSVVVHGVTFAITTGEIKGTVAPLQEIYLANQRHKQLYIINGVYALGLPSTKTEEVQVTNALDSVTFTK